MSNPSLEPEEKNVDDTTGRSYYEDEIEEVARRIGCRPDEIYPEFANVEIHNSDLDSIEDLRNDDYPDDLPVGWVDKDRGEAFVNNSKEGGRGLDWISMIVEGTAESQEGIMEFRLKGSHEPASFLEDIEIPANAEKYKGFYIIDLNNGKLEHYEVRLPNGLSLGRFRSIESAKNIIDFMDKMRQDLDKETFIEGR